MKIIKIIMILSLIAFAALKHKRRLETDDSIKSLKELKDDLDELLKNKNEGTDILKKLIKHLISLDPLIEKKIQTIKAVNVDTKEKLQFEIKKIAESHNSFAEFYIEEKIKNSKDVKDKMAKLPSNKSKRRRLR